MTSSSPRLDPRRFRRLVRFGSVALLCLAAMFVIYHSLLVPFVVSAFLTYLLLPFVERIERWRVPRWAAVLSLVTASLGVLTLAGARLVPVLYRQALLLLELIPRATATVLERWLPVAERYVAGLGFMTAEEVHAYISGGSLMSRFESQVQAGLASAWTTGTTLAGGIFNLLLIPVVTFFLLKDYPRFKANLRSLVPHDLIGPIRMLLRRIDETLRTVLKGQVTVAGILAVLYVIGLSVVGLRSALAIGLIAGICRVIPYLDVIVGSVLSTVVLLSDFHGWGQVLGVIIVFLVVQGVDGAFITPQVLGERIGLHPMLVIFSVIAFANWFGFWGVLLAIPVVAVLKVLFETAKPYYLSSKAYLPPES